MTEIEVARLRAETSLRRLERTMAVGVVGIALAIFAGAYLALLI